MSLRFLNAWSYLYVFFLDIITVSLRVRIFSVILDFDADRTNSGPVLELFARRVLGIQGNKLGYRQWLPAEIEKSRRLESF